MNMYARFGAMTATSTVVMLALMYLNTYHLDQVSFSGTRTYMAFVMGATWRLSCWASCLRCSPTGP